MAMNYIKSTFAGAALAMTAFAGAAQAATLDLLAENETTVEVTAPLAALGLGGAPTGTASVSINTAQNAFFAFGITGGTVDTDTGAALIEHDGSGVELFAVLDPSISATVGNFLIDTAGASVFGNVNGGSTSVRLFDLDLTTQGGIGLNISSDLAGALTAVFGADDLTGAQFGLANTNPVPNVGAVPLPAGAPLMLVAIGAFGVMRRRQKRAQLS